jgi:SRSO17 transposase
MLESLLTRWRRNSKHPLPEKKPHLLQYLQVTSTTQTGSEATLFMLWKSPSTTPDLPIAGRSPQLLLSAHHLSVQGQLSTTQSVSLQRSFPRIILQYNQCLSLSSSRRFHGNERHKWSHAAFAIIRSVQKVGSIHAKYKVERNRKW